MGGEISYLLFLDVTAWGDALVGGGEPVFYFFIGISRISDISLQNGQS